MRSSLVVSGVIVGVVIAAGMRAGIGYQANDQSQTVNQLRSQIASLNRQAAAQRTKTAATGAELNSAKARLTAADKAQANACPTPSYGADGTAAPLFCQTPDPVILSYYQKTYPWIFQLGPDATPGQVEAVIQKHTSTLPIECDAYTLAKALNHWSFGINPVEYCNA